MGNGNRVMSYILYSSIVLGIILFSFSIFYLGTTSDEGLSGDNTTSYTEIYSINSEQYDNATEERKLWNNGSYSQHKGERKHQSSTAQASDIGNPWFMETSSDIGLKYSAEHFPNTSISGYIEGKIGSGVFAADYNNDGWTDILGLAYFEPVLFRNDGGKFNKIKLPVDTNVTSAVFFDYDNDGWKDLYLLSDERSVFLRNENGSFYPHKVGLERGYDSVRGATVGDYTGNGCADVFVIQANDWDRIRPAGYNKQNVSFAEDNGEANKLFKNDCEEFEETTSEAGIRGTSWSLATSFADFTGNGDPDIHVANDFNNDVLYVNNGNGTFDRRVLPNFTNRNGMSSEVADISGNGHLDIFVSNIYYRDSNTEYAGRTNGNNLLLNRGNGTFKDVAEEYGVRKTGWGWAAETADFDNSGERDIYQTTMSLLGNKPTFLLQREGNREFVHRSADETGIETSLIIGTSVIDYDNDGYLEIVEAGLTDGFFRLYENNRDGNSSLGVKLSSEETVLGSKVTVVYNNNSASRFRTSGTDYVSQSPGTLHFGLGDAEVADEVRVDWPDGTKQVYRNVEGNQTISVSKGEGYQTVTELR